MMNYEEKLNLLKLGNEINKIKNGTSEVLAEILGVDLSERKYDFLDVMTYIAEQEKEIKNLKEEVKSLRKKLEIYCDI